MATPPVPADPAAIAHGIHAITLPDPRWKRCDIKSTALLGNVLAKGAAASAGAREAILIDGGLLREGSSSSVLIVAAGQILAPPDGPEILPGTTRELCLNLAAQAGIKVSITPITIAQLQAADELLVCNASGGVLAATTLDGQPVGSGQPGPVWRSLHLAFEAYRARLAGTPAL
jgi:D-alanine transaminase